LLPSAHGVVYKGIQTATNAVLAIKEIMHIQDESQMKNEIEILKKVRKKEGNLMGDWVLRIR
jgi:hypothetical protein